MAQICAEMAVDTGPAGLCGATFTPSARSALGNAHGDQLELSDLQRWSGEGDGDQGAASHTYSNVLLARNA